MFGRVFDGPLNIAIEAVVDVEVCAFRRAAFEDLLLRSPELERIALLNILNELDRARDWLIILGTPKVRGRLAGFLLVLCTRFAHYDHMLRRGNGRYFDIQVPIGRTDLAHLLGARPESISRAFRALADSGSIALKQPDLIEIRDLEALAEEAGEDEFGISTPLNTLLSQMSDRRS